MTSTALWYDIRRSPGAAGRSGQSILVKQHLTGGWDNNSDWPKASHSDIASVMDRERWDKRRYEAPAFSLSKWKIPEWSSSRIMMVATAGVPSTTSAWLSAIGSQSTEVTERSWREIAHAFSDGCTPYTHQRYPLRSPDCSTWWRNAYLLRIYRRQWCQV